MEQRELLSARRTLAQDVVTAIDGAGNATIAFTSHDRVARRSLRPAGDPAAGSGLWWCSAAAARRSSVPALQACRSRPPAPQPPCCGIPTRPIFQIATTADCESRSPAAPNGSRDHSRPPRRLPATLSPGCRPLPSTMRATCCLHTPTPTPFTQANDPRATRASVPPRHLDVGQRPRRTRRAAGRDTDSRTAQRQATSRLTRPRKPGVPAPTRASPSPSSQKTPPAQPPQPSPLSSLATPQSGDATFLRSPASGARAGPVPARDPPAGADRDEDSARFC